MRPLLHEPDLKAFVDDAFLTLCDTLLALQVGPSVEGLPAVPMEAQIIGMVGLAGSITAVVCLRVPEASSPALARAMTGAGPEEVLTNADITDVIGELTNIIAGKLKSCLRQDKSPCNLSLPTIVHGQHVDLESVSGTHRHSYTFTTDIGTLVLEFYSLNSETSST